VPVPPDKVRESTGLSRVRRVRCFLGGNGLKHTPRKFGQPSNVLKITKMDRYVCKPRYYCKESECFSMTECSSQLSSCNVDSILHTYGRLLVDPRNTTQSLYTSFCFESTFIRQTGA